ncbi:MAG: YicC/YloC family endoribonuclease [Eubacteriales bacterium]
MIKSMTGYGRGTYHGEGREVTVEIRSVNNRYLDCNVKMPRVFSFAEDGVKQKIKKSITRGKVDVYITMGGEETEGVKVTLNRPVLEGYLAAMNAIAEEYGVRNDVSVTALTRLPDVLQVEKPEADEDQIKADIFAAVDMALKAYDQMRCTEGQALEADLRSRADHILEMTRLVEERSPITVQEYRNRLTAKMQEVLDKTSIDESRILTEAAIYSDKIAVDEETVRLRSHLGQLDAMLSSGGAIGRKLDFLLQELNRESNTIGSKCNDLELSRVVVEIKSELEKIREQTQNIE